ncbi:hypothetical protein L486_04766 [Kwoniella mangroviensis CBS 10435]|uniref:Uncharacterized protein n=1 Tax=Kwoniella mangroviensis CBS 10435 TaxID=1331196 RepID=A0A1B9IPG8_9TREE|nr:hypothetical protein L486_04766 [Kwoniella mangroviensis CBS 10435]OCF76135.1 hypothetical protein I204_03434 [Kwoniella mangroviensis CBS 8886]
MSSSSFTDTDQARAELETLLFNDPEMKKLLIKGESINIRDMVSRLMEKGVKIENKQPGSLTSCAPAQKQQPQSKDKGKEKVAHERNICVPNMIDVQGGAPKSRRLPVRSCRRPAPPLDWLSDEYHEEDE